MVKATRNIKLPSIRKNAKQSKLTVLRGLEEIESYLHALILCFHVLVIKPFDIDVQMIMIALVLLVNEKITSIRDTI